MGNQIFIILKILNLIIVVSMLLLGILAVIQTVLIPGLILLYLFKIETGTVIQKWIYIFALSLFANYSLVTILTFIGIYKVFVVCSIIAVEILFIAYIVKVKKHKIISTHSSRDFFLKYLSYLKSAPTSERTLLISVSLIILFYFSLFISNISTIFYFVDTVNNIHWNTWAMDFANNIFPRHSSHFPQLIPSNWSISYLLIGEANVHFFPKSFMPLFFFGNLLMFLDLAISQKKYVYLIALIVYGLFAPIIYNLVFIADGNGDLPVSFFAFLSFYAYLKTDKQKYDLKEYTLVFLFATTAAGTKLAGFYVFFFMSILCFYYLSHNFRSLSKKEISALIVSVVFILSVNLFWYFMKPEVMAGGLHQPEWLTDGYLNILKGALHLLYYNWGLPVLAVFILTVLFSLFVKESRYVALFFVLPPIILWMFKYSSDFRNLSFVVPFLSYVSAFGVIKIIEILRDKKHNEEHIASFDKEASFDIKTKWLLIFFSALGLACFFLIRTNHFYQILYSTYLFISKYYFQSNRISYLTDFTFFLPVDYYQSVFAIMFLTISLVSLLVLFKVRIKYLFMLFVVSVFVLNYSMIKESDILTHQRKEFDRVDARIYYPRINNIIKNTKSDNQIFTNFEAICSEKTPREIEFHYMKNSRISQILNTDSVTESRKYFLRLNQLDEQIKEKISNQIKNGIFIVLYDDGDYLLISN